MEKQSNKAASPEKWGGLTRAEILDLFASIGDISYKEVDKYTHMLEQLRAHKPRSRFYKSLYNQRTHLTHRQKQCVENNYTEIFGRINRSL